MPNPLRTVPTRREVVADLPVDPPRRSPADRRLVQSEATSSAAPLRELTDLLGSFTEQTGALFE